MKSVKEVLKEELTGLYYGNRVLLPFQCNFLKIVIENDIITDFSKQYKGASVRETSDYTEIYFFDYPDLESVITKYENIKLIVSEKGENIFDMEKHIKIALHPEGNHILKISELDENTIFID